MARKPARKSTKGLHSDVAMREALKMTRNGIRIRTAAKTTGVDRTTLARYIKKWGDVDVIPEDVRLTSKYSHQQVFTAEQEADLMQYVLTRSAIGYGLTSSELRECAFEVATKNCVKIPRSWKENKKAGIDWYLGFMKRHPGLSARKPEQCSIARAAAFNKVNISNYFQKLKDVQDRHPNFQNGRRVFNLDEKRLSTVGVLKEKIISPKGQKQVHQAKGQERGTSMTMCGFICASGQSLPPVMIFPRVNFTRHMINGCYPGTLGLANKAGYMTKEMFVPTIKHFIEHSSSSLGNPSLLIVDNVGSHLTLDAVNMCKENGVTLLTLPPHTTHRTQTLDVGIFGPFETAYGKAVHQWQQNNPNGAATIYEIAANTAWSKSATPANILAAFKATGISPFNNEIFAEADFMPSLITKDQNVQEPEEKEEDNQHREEPQGEDMEELGETEDDPDDPEEVATEGQKNYQSATEILGLPKAKPSQNKQNRRKGKCMVATDTPEKNVIEEREHEIKKKQEEKEKRKAMREQKKTENKCASSQSKNVKKRKEVNERPVKRQKLKRQLKYDVETERESDSDKVDNEADEEQEIEEDEFPPLKKSPEEGEFVIVEFKAKPVKYFVGKIIANKDAEDNLQISYLRSSNKCVGKFVMPNVPDLKTVNIRDIKMILPLPTTSGTRRQQNFLDFNCPKLSSINLG